LKGFPEVPVDFFENEIVKEEWMSDPLHAKRWIQDPLSKNHYSWILSFCFFCEDSKSLPKRFSLFFRYYFESLIFFKEYLNHHKKVQNFRFQKIIWKENPDSVVKGRTLVFNKR
jgi:hypothetical protein